MTEEGGSGRETGEEKSSETWRDKTSNMWLFAELSRLDCLWL